MSLVELLVGLSMGLLVSLAAVGVLGQTRAASATLGDSTRLQQDADAAFRVLGHHLRQAGARRLQAVDPGRSEVVFNPAYTGYGEPTQTLAVTGSDGPGTAPDRLNASHDADPLAQTTDCLARIEPGTSNGVFNQWYVKAGELRCTGTGRSADAPLLQGVEDFQVWYGQGRPDKSLHYRRAAPDLPWSAVRAVMVCLQLVGDSGGHPAPQGQGCQGKALPDDGRLHRAFTRVFHLRSDSL
jgi:type IV pilus assembly protein PilW